MSNPLVEGEDYYWNEQGYVVLTEKHHLKRGYCCGMGCKHCPYDYESVPEPRRSELQDERRNADLL
ncbi:MAG: hypothetical protein EOP50_13055 [Sphingobacteriales bacterium]|nr:MAG: hypothetical protein EOP50_13055 [Sphingobacteriales bacterium]